MHSFLLQLVSKKNKKKYTYVTKVDSLFYIHACHVK